ncbi:MAG TPA: DUF411 domain-containing protein [Usitatibacter sp.]|nr:DUF411 domain-containing protein [Usitatibacter sp.]
MKSRREFLALLAAATVAPAVARAEAPPLVEIWKSPQCGCCDDWTKHLQKNGFATKVNVVADTTNLRRAAGIPEALGSCHTARVGGYSIEGHVPAKDIRRLLAEKPRATGLAVPGMPQSAPGMDNPGYPYNVLLVALDGRTSIYQRY